MRNSQIKLFLLVGIGIFFFLSITSLTIIITDILRDLLIELTPIRSFGVFVLIEATNILVFIFGSLYFIQWLKNNRTEHKKLFIGLITIYVLIQVFQILWHGIHNLLSGEYFYRLSDYYEFLNGNYILILIPKLIDLLLDLFLALILYQNRNLITAENSELSEIEQIGTQN